ncbi:hypothetical protein V8F06_004463 [Rhypophila decipiens]
MQALLQVQLNKLHGKHSSTQSRSRDFHLRLHITSVQTRPIDQLLPDFSDSLSRFATTTSCEIVRRPDRPNPSFDTMRLVNVESLRLELFYGDPTEPYAVLSHTWGKEDEELSFQNMHRLEEQDTARRAKLDGTCAQARKDGFKYVWIDTCCIDKTNAVELSEAITSMFRWYKKSRMCYTLLSDIGEGQTDRISKSRWFTRGWTLQELLASPRMTFFDSTWKVLGTKSSLSGPIMAATNIPHHILTGIANLNSASIAQKFSWASTRTTTRPEDMAYCLLGIFNIVIPPLYGEGLTAAFERLQEAIIKRTQDDSILAWDLTGGRGSNALSPKNKSLPAVSGGVLAASPAAFRGCGDIVQRDRTDTRIRISETSWGTIPITIYLQPGAGISDFSHVGYLSCGPKSDPSKVIAVPLVRCSEEMYNSHGPPLFLRPRDSKAIYVPRPTANPTMETILVHKDRVQEAVPTVDKSYWFYLPGPYPSNSTIEEVYPAKSYEEQTAMIRTNLNLEGESSIYLTRFSYIPSASHGVREGRYLLALEFYQGGKKEPRASLYFDDPEDQLVPLSQVAEMWPSLSTCGTSDIYCPDRGLTVQARISADAIAGNHLWTVTLSELSPPTKDFPPPGWPSISEQIRLRMHGISLVKHLKEGAALVREHDKLVDENEQLARTRREVENRLDEIEDTIQALAAEATILNGKLAAHKDLKEAQYLKSIDLYNSRIAKYTEVRDANSSRIEVRRVWFRSVSSGYTEGSADIEAEYPAREWKEAERLEHSGIVAFIMRHHPLTFKGKELQWLPGVTLLMYAAASGDKGLVQTTLEYDDDVDARDSEGRTAFEWAGLTDGDPSAVIGTLDSHRSRSKHQGNAVENQDTQPMNNEEEKRLSHPRTQPKLALPGPGRSSPLASLDPPAPSPPQAAGEKPPGQAQDPRTPPRPPSRKPETARSRYALWAARNARGKKPKEDATSRSSNFISGIFHS